MQPRAFGHALAKAGAEQSARTGLRMMAARAGAAREPPQIVHEARAGDMQRFRSHGDSSFLKQTRMLIACDKL